MNKINNILAELGPVPTAVVTKSSVTTVVTVQSLATAGAFNVNTRVVNLCIEGNSVRLKADGVAPTTAIGMLYPPGWYQFSIQYALAAKIVSVTGTAVVTLEELTYSDN